MQFPLESQQEKSNDKTAQSLSADRRLVGRRSCVQAGRAASGRARPRARKSGRSRLEGIGVDQARQRSDRPFSRGRAGVAGANQRCAAAGGGVVSRGAREGGRALRLAESPASVHRRRRRTGHFWQGRFGAVLMDEVHLGAAFRYVSLNPVRAARRAGLRLAMVERARPSRPQRRWRDRCARGPAALRRSARRSGRSGNVRAAAPGRNHRPAGRLGGFPDENRSADGARPAAAQARAGPERDGDRARAGRRANWRRNRVIANRISVSLLLQIVPIVLDFLAGLLRYSDSFDVCALLEVRKCLGVRSVSRQGAHFWIASA